MLMIFMIDMEAGRGKQVQQFMQVHPSADMHPALSRLRHWLPTNKLALICIWSSAYHWRPRHFVIAVKPDPDAVLPVVLLAAG
jgi:hypothetical protein